MIALPIAQSVVDAGLTSFQFVVQRSDESGDRDEEEQGGWGGASRNESVLAEEMPPKDLERLGFSSDLVSMCERSLRCHVQQGW